MTVEVKSPNYRPWRRQAEGNFQLKLDWRVPCRVHPNGSVLDFTGDQLHEVYLSLRPFFEDD